VSVAPGPAGGGTGLLTGHMKGRDTDMAVSVFTRCYRCGTPIADAGSVVHDFAADAVGTYRPVMICWGCHTGEPAGVVWSECGGCGVVSDSVPCCFCDGEA
jgi:hypothetical protein